MPHRHHAHTDSNGSYSSISDNKVEPEIGEEQDKPQKQPGFLSTIFKQTRTMLRKDFLVTIRHPILLVLEILVPALLFLTICDNRFVKKDLTENYAPKQVSLFNVSKRFLGYYQPNGSTSEQIFHLSGVMNELAKLYDPPLDSTQLVALGTEEQAKNAILKCEDCYWAVFSVNVIDIYLMKVNYTWRVHEQYINDQESGATKDRLHDDVIAENMMEQALINYFLTIPELAQKSKLGKLKSYSSNVSIQQLSDVQYFVESGIYNKVASGAPVVLGLSCIFSFFAFSYHITQEKQLKLRQSLHTVGLRDFAFWTSLTIIAIGISALQSLLLTICGRISGYVYFKNTAFGLNFFIIWLIFLGSHTFAFIIGALIPHMKVLSFVVFVLIILYFVVGTMCTNHKSIYPEFGGFSAWQLLFLSHGSQALYLISLKAIPYIDVYLPTSGSFFSYKDSYTFTGVCADASCDPNGYNDMHTVGFCVAMMLICIFVQIVLAAYIDLIMPYAHGSSLPFYAPFTPEFWGLLNKSLPPPSNFPGYKCHEPLAQWDQEVRAEAKRVLSPLGSVEYNSVRESALMIYELNVVYPSLMAKKHAVHDLSLAVPRNSVVGILGANGAGKSTTLNVITGSQKITSGEVYVNQLSVRNQRRQISELIGYAPQFDVLWPDLSPAEHVRIFADLRGIGYQVELQQINAQRIAAQKAGLAHTMAADEESNESGESENDAFIQKLSQKEALAKLIKKRLEDVNLFTSADVAAKSLSGGMRRRLTLCLSLVGNPPLLLLDEISTGLDPIGRRKIWDVILKSKTDRTIVLTTHSMEECDVLSDKICVLAHGIMRCLGTSDHLKNKYGMGYRIDITCEFDPISGKSDVLRIKHELVDKYLPEALLVGRTGGHLTLAVAKAIDQQKLDQFLKSLEESEVVKNWGVRQTTLEEVFLSINRHADKVEMLKEILK